VAHERAAATHLRAADLHDRAAAFHQEHALEERKLGHVEQAQRMEALAHLEREKARNERQSARLALQE